MPLATLCLIGIPCKIQFWASQNKKRKSNITIVVIITEKATENLMQNNEKIFTRKNCNNINISRIKIKQKYQKFKLQNN